MEKTINKYIIPKTLRKKNVSSKIAREIFFIDCINDLRYCADSGASYHLIRSSVLLRMLLLDRGLELIASNYTLPIEFSANANEITGLPLTKKQVRNIKTTIEELRTKTFGITKLSLKYSFSKKYDINGFNDKICLQMIGSEMYYFSIANIIELISNKHGAAHLESNFDSTGLETFLFTDFSPFSLNDGNYFLEKIKEIIEIVMESIASLAILVLKNLELYNKSISQAEASCTITFGTNNATSSQ